MANIKIVQRKSSKLPWVIGLLALLLAVFGIRNALDRDDETVANAAPAAATEAAPLTDVAAISAVSGAAADGRIVQLSKVAVQSVPGDELFWVGADSTQRVLVAIDPAPGTDAEEESPENVKAGQIVNVAGVLRTVPANVAELGSKYKMDKATLAALQPGQPYVATQRVNVTPQR